MYTIFYLRRNLQGEKREVSQASVTESLAFGESGGVDQSVSKESLASFTTFNEEPQHASSRRVKLPKLELRKFNGKIVDWPEFWDSFCTASHHEQELAKADELKSVIKEFSLIEADYDEAATLLRKRFER